MKGKKIIFILTCVVAFSMMISPVLADHWYEEGGSYCNNTYYTMSHSSFADENISITCTEDHSVCPIFYERH